VKKVKPRLNPTHDAGIEFAGDKTVKDGFVAIVCGPGYYSQVTYHHPIGCTNLKGDVYVCTPTKDVQSLILGKDNPYASDIISARKKHILKKCVGLSKLKFLDTNEEIVGYPNGTNRSQALKAARAALKDFKVKEPDGTKTYLDFLSPEDKQAETDYLTYSSKEEVVKRAEAEFPDRPYETCSGLYNQVKQEPSWVEGKSPSDAMKLLVSRISMPKEKLLKLLLEELKTELEGSPSGFIDDSPEAVEKRENIKMVAKVKDLAINLKPKPKK